MYFMLQHGFSGGLHHLTHSSSSGIHCACRSHQYIDYDLFISIAGIIIFVLCKKQQNADTAAFPIYFVF